MPPCHSAPEPFTDRARSLVAPPQPQLARSTEGTQYLRQWLVRAEPHSAREPPRRRRDMERPSGESLSPVDGVEMAAHLTTGLTPRSRRSLQSYISTLPPRTKERSGTRTRRSNEAWRWHSDFIRGSQSCGFGGRFERRFWNTGRKRRTQAKRVQAKRLRGCGAPPE